MRGERQKEKERKRACTVGRKQLSGFVFFLFSLAFFFWKDMEGSGKYGLGHENRIFDNPPFTLERKKKKGKMYQRQ